MTYRKPTIEDLRDEPIYAGACGDYSSGCYQQVHKSSGNAKCGDFSSGCGDKVHKS